MATTLVEYEKLVVDALKKGIAQSIYHESPMLRVLPFKGITSNTIKYKVEGEEAGADFYEVNEEWVESTPTWDDRYADLVILGGDADVDNFVKSTMSSQEAVEAEVIDLKSKAIARRFEKCAILGRTTANTAYNSSKIFKGLLRLIAECESDTTTDLDGAVYGSTGNNSQVLVGAASASAVLTLDYLDYLIDIVKPNPTHLITSRLMKNKITALARAAGNNLKHDKDELGFPVTSYGDYPILIDDGIPDNMPDPSSSVTTIATYDITTTRAATADITPIFAVRVGEDGFCGITSAQNGMIQTEPIGTLENKDATRTRIKFYCGLALYNIRAAGVLMGMTNA